MERRLTAILSADVKGYSRLMGEDEVATIRTLTAYREVMASLIQQHRGRVVDTPGDNLLAEFASVVDAVQCGVEIQRQLKVRNAELTDQRKMEFRIGINLGDVVVDGERIYGDGVNIAARVEGLAEGGGICISRTVYEHIKNKLALGYESLGEHTVKNITEPVRVYRVRVEREAAARREKTPALELPDKPSVAVLPFVNMTEDPKQEYFADGITEEIITALSKISDLFVTARNSTFTYKGRAVKVQQVAEELGVRYVLEGSVRKAGERARITAQLVDATTGRHLWAERYDRDLRDIFALQDEITQEIVVALQVELTEGEQARVRQKSTHNLEAWGYAVRGYGFFERSTRSDNAKARELFERAVRLDSEYAWAWTWLAWTYWIDARLGFTHWVDVRMGLSESRDESFNKAIELAQKAAALDDSQPDVHALLGSIHLFQRQYEPAIAEGERAITLGPNNAESHAILARTLYYAGRYDEAIALFKKAMRLSPHYPHWYLIWLGHAYRFTGQYEEALATHKQLLERREGVESVMAAHLGLACTYSELGREQEARAHAAEMLRINPNFSVEWVRSASFFKDPNHLARLLDCLRKAGLP